MIVTSQRRSLDRIVWRLQWEQLLEPRADKTRFLPELKLEPPRWPGLLMTRKSNNESLERNGDEGRAVREAWLLDRREAASPRLLH